MIKYIDPSGREFDSVRSALRANNKERYMSGAICNRLKRHVHKYCSIYTRGIHGISAPAMQMQTGFMQAKKLEAHTGFLLLEFDTENYRVRNLTLTYFPFDA